MSSQYWLQTQAPAGNWVDRIGSEDDAYLFNHAIASDHYPDGTWRIVKRTDEVIQQPTVPLYDVYDDKDAFMMRAPMDVIARVFSMHKDAVRRVDAETLEGQISRVHFNGRGGYVAQTTSILIQAAVGER